MIVVICNYYIYSDFYFLHVLLPCSSLHYLCLFLVKHMWEISEKTCKYISWYIDIGTFPFLISASAPKSAYCVGSLFYSATLIW